MGQALYRKYRSKSLKDVVGQEHITDTLGQALKQGRISHAYLFTGPRGVGKTSVARIWAHEINGLPYDDDSAHLDIIEIDAASNRRIDEIRELRDKVYVAPTSAKYKVYIIDEVHMLTREAFNALLKTLEEPPEHVVFILATTDPQKLPETIVSRTQRFSFKPAEPDAVVMLLQKIAKAEGIKIDTDSLALIAEHAGGSFRDSVSLLDQASSHGRAVDVAEVRQLLGVPPTAALQALLDVLSTAAPAATVVAQLTALYDQGFQAAGLAKQLSRLLRAQLIDDAAVLGTTAVLQLLQELLKVPSAHDPAVFLEICLLQALPERAGSAPTKPTAPTAKSQKVAEPEVVVQPEVETPSETPAEAEQSAEVETPAPQESQPTGTAVLNDELWPEVLAALKKRHNTLYSVVRMAQPRFSDKTLELVFAFGFHQKRINEAENRQRLSDIIHSLTGEAVSITAVVDAGAQPPKVAVVAVAPPELTTISNIFGGGELLES
jgi:DNA polymerase-3 subunit gamma/tau